MIYANKAKLMHIGKLCTHNKTQHLTANQQALVEKLRGLEMNERGEDANRKEERERETDGSVWLSLTMPADIWGKAGTGALKWERKQPIPGRPTELL